ncbi:MAG: F0F1 ATP synthase subunit beta [Candidatus Spechtbacterales bacterium]|nr:F0F1 ATP synthase subunit beta [Candidatus Spechtbacterales bacterium]
MATTQKNIIGEVISIRGLVARVAIYTQDKPPMHELLILENSRNVLLEVEKYQDSDTAFCVILRGDKDVHKGDKVIRTNSTISIPVGEHAMGRMFNALGLPIDNGEEIKDVPRKGIYDMTHPYEAISSEKNYELLETGIKVVDFFTPFVKGSKIGIAGGAGVGKTVLISAIIHSVAKKKIAMPMFTGIGERIHEGQEMYEALKATGLLKEAVLFMGQMNESASIRTLVGRSAAALAQYYRDEEHKDILFFVDNIYRFVQAGNELSTMMGEIPSEGAYQPTIFSDLRRFQERLYSTDNGSITAVQTIYIPADDVTDPAVQEIEQQLDSVIVLSRKKAENNIYPAVDLLATRSSMVTPQIVGERHYNLVTKVQAVIQRYESLRTIVSIIGEHELSQEDRVNYRKARTLVKYFAQELYGSGDLSGQGASYFDKKDTLDGVEEILNSENI